jgi:hypothetical protein
MTVTGCMVMFAGSDTILVPTGRRLPIGELLPESFCWLWISVGMTKVDAAFVFHTG